MRSLAVLAACAGCDVVLGLKSVGADASPPPVDALADDSCSSITMLADDFSSQPLSLHWQTYATAFANTAIEQGGQLELALGTPDSSSALESKRYYDIRKHSFSLAISVAGTFESNDTWTLNLVSEQAQYGAAFTRTGDILYFVNQTPDHQEIIGQVPVTNDVRYLRIAVDGDQVSWLVSSDGIAYTPQVAAMNPAMTFVKAQLEAYRDASSPPYTLIVDHANGEQPSGAACPIRALADDFEGQRLAPHWGRSSVVAGTVVQAGGQVIMATESTNPSQANPSIVLGASTVYDLSNSSVVLEIPKMIGIGPDRSVTLTAASTVGDRMVIQQVNGELKCITHHDGADGGTTVAFDAGRMVWWRISEAAGVVACATSPDGIAWAVQTSIANMQGFAETDISFGTFASTQVDDSATFDNFNLAPQ